MGHIELVARGRARGLVLVGAAKLPVAAPSTLPGCGARVRGACITPPVAAGGDATGVVRLPAGGSGVRPGGRWPPGVELFPVSAGHLAGGGVPLAAARDGSPQADSGCVMGTSYDWRYGVWSWLVGWRFPLVGVV